MMNERPIVSTLINHHFCIENSESENILNVIETSYIESIILDSEFDWDYLYGAKNKESRERFLLFDKINNWNYLFWEDKFWQLYNQICQPIEILNTY